MAMPLGQTWWTTQSDFTEIKDLCSAKPLAGGTLYMSVLVCNNCRFVLKERIGIQETYEGDRWVHRCEPLGILAYGRSREEASEVFCEEFACCWEEIACEDDNLTADALELKNRLRSLVNDAIPIE
jgi:hypothetical protein